MSGVWSRLMSFLREWGRKEYDDPPCVCGHLWSAHLPVHYAYNAESLDNACGSCSCDWFRGVKIDDFSIDRPRRDWADPPGEPMGKEAP